MQPSMTVLRPLPAVSGLMFLCGGNSTTQEVPTVKLGTRHTVYDDGRPRHRGRSQQDHAVAPERSRARARTRAPSGGDTSCPSLVRDGGRLPMSYYSEHGSR